MDIDFAAIEAQAMAGQTDASAESTTTTDVASPKTQTEQAAPSEPSIEVELPDGRKRVLTAKEVRDGILMQSDYTKKTTEVAEMRKAAEKVFSAYQQLQSEYETYQQEREALAEFLQDPDKVTQFVAKKYGAEGVKALLNHLQPQDQQQNQGVSPQQAERLVEQKLRAMQQGFTQSQSELEQNFQKRLEMLEAKREVETYSAQIAPIIATTLENFPVLKDDPYAETLLRFEVAEAIKANPEITTVKQAEKLFGEFAKRRADMLTRRFVDANKQAIIGKEKLKNGIEPPGGSGVVPQPKTYIKAGTNKMDWRAIEADAIARLSR